MEKWKPISKQELDDLIVDSESKMTQSELNLWNAIKVPPEKWKEKQFGNEGGGFWIVAIMGKSVLYYNDIEDGFNSSDFTEYGEIKSYVCDQIELIDIIRVFVKSL